MSFALNYDGAPKFKSSGLQVRPIQLCLNELPPHIRYMVVHFVQSELVFLLLCMSGREYTFIAGIWCSPEKPPASSFLKPVMNTLNILDDQGTGVKKLIKPTVACLEWLHVNSGLHEQLVAHFVHFHSLAMHLRNC